MFDKFMLSGVFMAVASHAYMTLPEGQNPTTKLAAVVFIGAVSTLATAIGNAIGSTAALKYFARPKEAGQLSPLYVGLGLAAALAIPVYNSATDLAKTSLQQNTAVTATTPAPR